LEARGRQTRWGKSQSDNLATEKCGMMHGSSPGRESRKTTSNISRQGRGRKPREYSTGKKKKRLEPYGAEGLLIPFWRGGGGGKKKELAGHHTNKKEKKNRVTTESFGRGKGGRSPKMGNCNGNYWEEEILTLYGKSDLICCGGGMQLYDRRSNYSEEKKGRQGLCRGKREVRCANRAFCWWEGRKESCSQKKGVTDSDRDNLPSKGGGKDSLLRKEKKGGFLSF